MAQQSTIGLTGTPSPVYGDFSGKARAEPSMTRLGVSGIPRPRSAAFGGKEEYVAPPPVETVAGVGGYFIWHRGKRAIIVEGRERSVDEPDEKVAKEIVRRVFKINLPKETRAEVNDILFGRPAEPTPEKKLDRVDYSFLVADAAAYHRLVDILFAHAREEEEMALIMAMMGIEDD